MNIHKWWYFGITRYVPTGKSTFLHSFATTSKKGTVTVLPKNAINNSGVTNTPSKLPITALQSAEATLPPADRVKITHMLTVVGRQDRIKMPSSNVELPTIPKLLKTEVMGTPNRKGHAKKDVNWTNVFNFQLVAAFLNSETSIDNPDMKKYPWHDNSRTTTCRLSTGSH